LSEEEPEKVISVLIEQQEQLLTEELKERQSKMDLLIKMKKELKNIKNFSVESIGDMAYAMENKKEMKKLHAILLITGLPITMLEWFGIIYGIITGIWWPCLIYLVAIVPYAIWVSKFYFSRVAYICPQCHEIFKPALKEAFWANHTPTLRKLSCTCCGYKGLCVETYGKEEK